MENLAKTKSIWRLLRTRQGTAMNRLTLISQIRTHTHIRWKRVMTYSKSILMQTPHEAESQHACSQSTEMSKWETAPVVHTLTQWDDRTTSWKGPNSGMLGEREETTGQMRGSSQQWNDLSGGESCFSHPLCPKQDGPVPARLHPSQALPRLAGLLAMSPSRLCKGWPCQAAECPTTCLH